MDDPEDFDRLHDISDGCADQGLLDRASLFKIVLGVTRSSSWV